MTTEKAKKRARREPSAMLTIDPIGSAEAGFSLFAFWIGFEVSAVVDSDGELSLGGAGSA
jgi:hypothetical protein